jgi:hypothetical protein
VRQRIRDHAGGPRVCGWRSCPDDEDDHGALPRRDLLSARRRPHAPRRRPDPSERAGPARSAGWPSRARLSRSAGGGRSVTRMMRYRMRRLGPGRRGREVRVGARAFMRAQACKQRGTHSRPHASTPALLHSRPHSRIHAHALMCAVSACIGARSP